jgi:DHA1 family multidrug resistance protein-like MFS transporter
MVRWKRNLIVLCGAQLLTMIGFSGYLPMMPLYIQQLGNFDAAEAAVWTARFNTSSAVAMMIAAPIWGSVSDRYGRKIMLVRATLMGAVLAYLMGLMQTPGQVIVIRTLQGFFCGTVSAAMTMVSTTTPEEHLGTGLGMMQTVQYVGHAVGPLIGGAIADSFGYASVFPISAGMISIAFVSVSFLVHEKFARAPSKTGSQRRGISGAFSGVVNGNITTLLISLGSMSFALAMLSPVLTLYVKSLQPDAPRIATLAGAVVSITAFTSSASSLVVGRLGDKLGQKRVLLICAVCVAAIYVPQGLVQSPLQLIILRAIQGVFVGGMVPTANALLAKSTATANRGTVFGLANSVQAGSRAVGPMVGAAIAGAMGMASVFFAVSFAYVILAIVVGVLVKAQPVVNNGGASVEAQPASAPDCPA